jgi:hypothetical protein
MISPFQLIRGVDVVAAGFLNPLFRVPGDRLDRLRVNVQIQHVRIHVEDVRPASRGHRLNDLGIDFGVVDAFHFHPDSVLAFVETVDNALQCDRTGIVRLLRVEENPQAEFNRFAASLAVASLASRSLASRSLVAGAGIAALGPG